MSAVQPAFIQKITLPLAEGLPGAGAVWSARHPLAGLPSRAARDPAPARPSAPKGLNAGQKRLRKLSQKGKFLNQDCLENRVAHPVTYYVKGAPAFTLPPADKRRVLRLGVHRQPAVIASPQVDEVSVAPKRLPWLLGGRFYVVSRDIRIAYHWRPDFLSIADLVYEHGKVVGCRRFIGNRGMAEWQTRPGPANIVVSFWTDVEIMPADRTLVINLMTRKEKHMKGAVNIPPGKHQLRFLDDSLPTYLPVQFLGDAPRDIPPKWQRLAVSALTPTQESQNEDV